MSKTLFKVKKYREEAEIPTASMADIAFLLIVFFMLTTVFTANKGIEYGIPKKEKNATIKPEESIYIHIKKDGYYVDFKKFDSIDEISGYIESKMEKTNFKKPVVIRTDPDVNFQKTVTILDLLNQIGVKNISIPTEEEIREWKEYFQD